MSQSPRTLVGFVNIPEGQSHSLSHEVAAWSTTVALTAGRYPVYAATSYGRRSLYAQVPGVISQNSTPALYGGVRIGREPAVDPSIGRAHTCGIGGGAYAFRDGPVFPAGMTFEAFEGADLCVGYGVQATADAVIPAEAVEQ